MSTASGYNTISEPEPALDDRWVKAAVVGGLWASFEIVIGSFLHNLHIPFTGSTLTFIATIFIVSFYRVWPVKGLIWRAGLICALMKSVSPSAVILGPMTGIFMEALFLDLVLRLGDRRLPVILLAGAMSQLSALIHKVGGMLLRYGWDIVRIYENMFEFAIRQFRNLEITPVHALAWIVLIYFLAGMLAAYLGYRLGGKTIPTGNSSIRNTTSLKHGKTWDAVDPNQRFSFPLLLLHLVLFPVIMILLDRIGLSLIPLSLLAAYLLFTLLRYPKIRFRLLKPFFWVHLILIAVMAGLFWDPPDGESAGEWSGWITGLMLNLRAILVITGFSAFSTELRNPELKNFLFRFGFRKVYDAVSMAFSALPLMMERGTRGWQFLARPVRSIRSLLADANEWFYVIQQDQIQDPPQTKSN